jgi:hypothetical protein
MKRRLVLVLVVLLLPVAAAVGGLLALIVTAPVTPRVHVAPAADPTGAAVQALRDDDPLLALAYLAQVPSDDLNYGWAQRATARVQVERLGQPAAGLGPALAAVAREPAESWRTLAWTVDALFRR